MSYPSLAIIGTAGRGSDKDKLSKDSYDRMVSASIRLIDHLGFNRQELRLFSGGAAWADHVVVTLGLQGIVPCHHISLYLPCDYNDKGFVGQGHHAEKTASTANYYHQRFSREIGQDSFKQILEIGRCGAALFAGNGNFFTRNTLVAQSVSPDGVLIAYTTGHPDSKQQPWTLKPWGRDTKAREAGLKDGGSADCWSKCKAKLKYHGQIGFVQEQLELL